MIKFNKLDEDSIQILGSHNGVNVNGRASRVHVAGNQKKVWQFNAVFLKHPSMLTCSNPNDGTVHDEGKLMDRLLKICEEELK